MGCGRVGSSLARSLDGSGTRSPSSTRTRRRSAGSAPSSPATRSPVSGFDRETLHRGRHRPGRRVRGGQQRRQLQHHLRPGGPGDVRRRARRRPHLRPQAGRGLRAARASRPWPPCRGRPTGCCACCSRDRRAEDVARPDRHGRRWPQVPAARGLDRPAVRDAGGGDRRPGGVPRPASAAACCRPAETVLQDGDLVHVLLVTDDIADAVEPSPAARRGGGALMRVAIAGAGKVGRSIAAGAHRERPPGDAHRPRPARRSSPAGSAGASGCRPTPASSPRWRRPACRLRRRDRGHRRRQGQPGRVAAGEDRVRGPPGRRPGQPPAQRVAVQRGLGRRRRGLHPAHAGGAGRGGGHGRRPGPADDASGRARPTSSRSRCRRTPRVAGRPVGDCGCRGTPRSWRSCAAAG